MGRSDADNAELHNAEPADSGARSVGAVLTRDELRALAAELKSLVLLGSETDEHDRAAMSALRKLLGEPSALACCYQERARIVTQLKAQLLDETPSKPDGLDALREAGYRAGWNDRARSLAKELQS